MWTCRLSRWKRARLNALLLGQWLSLVKAEKARLEAVELQQKADAEVRARCSDTRAVAVTVHD